MTVKEEEENEEDRKMVLSHQAISHKSSPLPRSALPRMATVDRDLPSLARSPNS